MKSRQLFETLRRERRRQLAASGAEFGIVEVCHGMMKQETTTIVYTDLKQERFCFVPKIMEGVEGLVDVKIGNDQIWIHTNRPVRMQVQSITSHHWSPLRVMVDVYRNGDCFALNILVPTGMNAVRVAVVTDTASLFRIPDPDLPAMSMVGPLFEGLQPSSPEDPIDAMLTDLVDSFRATLGHGHRVEATMKQSPRKGSLGSLFERLLGGRKAKEGWQLPPGVRLDGDHFVIEADSLEAAMETYRLMNATKPVGMKLPPALFVEKAAGASSSSAYSRRHGGGVTSDPWALYEQFRSAGPSSARRAQRHGTNDDLLWSMIEAMGAEFGHPSFTRPIRGMKECKSGDCVSCCDSEGCYRPLNLIRRHREAEEATVCVTCSVQDVCRRNLGLVHQCWEAVQANQSQSVAEPAAETTDVGEKPTEDTVVATQTANDTVADDPAEQSAQDQADVTDESATGVAEAQAPASSDGSAS